MSNTMFRRGYQEVQKEKHRQEEDSKKRQGRLYKFYLVEDGDEADIQFVTEEPINVYTHNHKTFRNGKEMYEDVLCTKEDCEDCQRGERPSFKSAYLIIDKREVTVNDKDNPRKKKTIKDQMRLFMYGTKVTSQCERISKKYGLTGRICTLVKLGVGQKASYTLEKGDPNKLSSKQIKALLPEALQDMYDGTDESLYNILEEQLMKMSPADTEVDKDEDSAEEDKKTKSRIISTDDDDEDEDEELDLDEMTDKELINLAKENGIKPKTSGIGTKMKLLKRDDLIEELQELLGEEDSDEDDEDSAEDLSEEELEDLDDDDLVEYAEQRDIEPVYSGIGRRKKLNRDATIEAIVDGDSEDEDEEEEKPQRNTGKSSSKLDTRTMFKKKR